MSTPTVLLPFQPASMSTAQLAAVSFLARYSGRTHHLYQFQLREWFAWCEGNGLDPLVGVQRAHVELYIRSLGERGLMDSSVVMKIATVAGIPGISAHTRYGTRRSLTHWMPVCHCATRRSSPATPTPEPPSTTTAPAAIWTGMRCTS
jgi:site-specific recombinase XerC